MARGRVVRKLHLAHSQGGHGSDGPAPWPPSLAPHSPDFSPGPFRTVETQLGILSLLCQSCQGGEAGPPPHLSQGQI